METLQLLGKPLPEGVGGRDAVHIAVEPAVATERLQPAQRVNARGGSERPHVGIVDPFLRNPVEPGERFFVCLFPQTITSLRHVWQHPAFPDEVDRRVRTESPS